MKKLISIASLILFCAQVSAQNSNVFVRYSSDDNTTRIKWFSPELVISDGVNLYRSENGGDWEKINAEPIRPGSQELETDSEKAEKLRSVAEMFEDPEFDYQGNALVQLVILQQVIPSEELSLHLGIQFYDNTVRANATYRYKVVTANNLAETIGESREVKTSGNDFGEAPQEVITDSKNKSISIGWKKESERYYGVNVYRGIKGKSDSKKKLNTVPILFSEDKTRGKGANYLFVDKDVEKDVLYEYTLATVDYFGKEAGETTISASTKDVIPPPIPLIEGKDENHKDLSIAVSWYPLEAEDLASFNILRSDEENGEYSEIANGIPADSSYAFVKIGEIGRHWIKIEAVDEAGNKSQSTASLAVLEDHIPPAIPTGLAIASDSGLVSLSWNPNSEADLEGYYIFRKKTKNGTHLKITTNALKKTQFQEELPAKLVADVSYQVMARDTNGNYSDPTEIAITFEDNNPPSKPQIQEIRMEGDQVQFNWLKPVAADLAGFTIYRMSEIDSVWTKLNITDIAPVSESYTDISVDPGVKYSYRILAYDTAGNESEFSNIKSITRPKEKVVVEVKKFSAKMNQRNKKVRIQWEVSEPDVVLAYMLYSQDEKGNMIPISGKLTQTEFEYKAEKEEGSITYQLKVFDRSGRKYLSKPQTVTIKS